MDEEFGFEKSPESELPKVEEPFDGALLEEQEEEKEKGSEVRVKAGEREEMKPWEQHSAVISIPRFDYSAPSSILGRSHSGFLITCPIKREKSATKEAMSIFEKHITVCNDLNAEYSESMDAIMSAKRRRICGNIELELGRDTESKGGGNECGQPDPVMRTKTSSSETSNPPSPVKLTRSGLLLFIFPEDWGPAVVDIVLNIIQARECGNLKAPQWCHRIFPIQATCCLDEKEVHNVVIQLVKQFLKDSRNKVEQPVKFAVGFNRRGIEETEMKHVKATSNGANGSALLDRNKCFSVVAAAVKEVVPDSVVDLKCPDIAVLVEVLPLAGIPNEKVVVGISVLPQTAVGCKPRLCIKALVNDAKKG